MTRDWIVFGVWLAAIAVGGIHRGLQARFGPNVRDGYQRERYRSAVYLLNCELQRIGEYYDRSVWWPPYDIVVPLANYAALMRCIEFQTVIARAKPTHLDMEQPAIGRVPTPALLTPPSKPTGLPVLDWRPAPDWPPLP